MNKRIDLEAIKEKLQIEQKAKEAGTSRPPIPASNDIEFDAPQKDIVGYFRDMLVARKNSAQDDIKRRLDEMEVLEIEIENDNIDTVCGRTEIAIKEELTKSEQDLSNAYKSCLVDNRLFRKFKFDNNLDRDAVYPESKIFHWAVIALILLLETIGNSYFFAQGSNLGFVGGAFQALLVSVVNIGLALFIGTIVLPYKNGLTLEEDFPKICLFLVSIVSLATIVFFLNLAVAHYRDVLGDAPLEAIKLAIPKLIKSLFGIVDIDAWMLFGTGILAATLAILKGYYSDDIHPNYGKLDRKNKAINADYAELKETLLHKILDLINYGKKIDADEDEEAKAHEGIKAIDIYQATYRKNINRYRGLISSCEKAYKGFSDELLDIEKGCNQLLTHYREINIAIRGVESPAPRYFNEEYSFDEVDSKLEELDLTRQKQQSERFDQESKETNAKVASAYKAIGELSEKARKEIFPAHIQEIEQSVLDNEKNKSLETIERENETLV